MINKNFWKGKKVLVTGHTGFKGGWLSIWLKVLGAKVYGLSLNPSSNPNFFQVTKIKNIFEKDVRENIQKISSLKKLVNIHKPQIIFHLAAQPQVLESYNDPMNTIKTNVIGTSNILEASIIEEVEKFVFISTDKATNPTSTLGGSKLLAERLTLDAGTYAGKGKTKFAIVRFGNVLGSRGSVFQIFQNQIKMKKPLTVTDKRMTRFIMSISEAASMILKVTKILKDGEIYILKMPSIRIEDLAKGMLHVYGSRFPDYRNTSSLKITKPRGERFHELLITNEEMPFCHDIGDMYKISKTENKKQLQRKEFSSETASRISQSKLHKTINELINEYV